MKSISSCLMLIAAALMLCISSASFASDNKTSVDITSVGMGARPIALGGAYTSIADDASAIFTNPGGLGIQKRLSFVSMSTQLLTCVDYSLVAASYPTQYGTFGVGYISVVAPGGDFSSVSGGVTTEGGPIYYSNQMFVISYGCDISDQVSGMLFAEEGQIKNFGVGANIKFMSQGLSGDIKKAPSATGVEADLGALYVPNDRLTFGATLQNIYRGRDGESLSWSSGEQEDLPSFLKLGVSYRIVESVTLALDNDISIGLANRNAYRGGIEWQVIPLLALRAGVDQKNAAVDNGNLGLVADYTLGIGITLDGFRFDYAYRQDQIFNEFSTHYFSFCYFGVEEKQIKTEKETVAANYEELIDSSVEK